MPTRADARSEDHGKKWQRPNLPSVNYAERSRRLHRQQSGPLTWTTASKTAFASALTRSGPHMAMCTAKPISIGLRPSGKSWRHLRPRSPANPPRKRCAGRLHVRKPPRTLRGPAKAAHHTRDVSTCSAAISTLSGRHGLYLEKAIDLEIMAADEPDPKLKASLLQIVAAHRKLAHETLSELAEFGSSWKRKENPDFLGSVRGWVRFTPRAPGQP